MTDQSMSPDSERAAFIKANRGLDCVEMPDAWGRPMFQHTHVEAMWSGWKARAALDVAATARKLDWQETFTDRGDGSKEQTGWEADCGFGHWYTVEQYFGSDSYGWHAKFDYETVGDHDDPDQALQSAQADFEKRILACIIPDAAATPLHDAVVAYLSFLRRSVNVGPLTKNPSKEAALLRRLMELTYFEPQGDAK